MDKLFAILNLIVDNIVGICRKILKVIVPVAGVLIGSDVILGTKFGVLSRLVSILSKVGITGNMLTALVVVALVLWYNNKK